MGISLRELKDPMVLIYFWLNVKNLVKRIESYRGHIIIDDLGAEKNLVKRIESDCIQRAACSRRFGNLVKRIESHTDELGETGGTGEKNLVKRIER